MINTQGGLSDLRWLRDGRDGGATTTWTQGVEFTQRATSAQNSRHDPQRGPPKSAIMTRLEGVHSSITRGKGNGIPHVKARTGLKAQAVCVCLCVWSTADHAKATHRQETDSWGHEWAVPRGNTLSVEGARLTKTSRVGQACSDQAVSNQVLHQGPGAVISRGDKAAPERKRVLVTKVREGLPHRSHALKPTGKRPQDHIPERRGQTRRHLGPHTQRTAKQILTEKR